MLSLLSALILSVIRHENLQMRRNSYLCDIMETTASVQYALMPFQMLETALSLSLEVVSLTQGKTWCAVSTAKAAGRILRSLCVKFSIFNGGSDALVEQQVAIDFDSISAVERKEMLPDCSDVRLRRLAIRRKESIFSVRSSSLSASYLNLPYWLDASTCNTTQTRIWLKVSSLDANETLRLAITYGNTAGFRRGPVNRRQEHLQGKSFHSLMTFPLRTPSASIMARKGPHLWSTIIFRQALHTVTPR